MTLSGEGLQPSEFAVTASRAVADCAALGLREQARHLANDGLLGVIASQGVGGLDLPLAFAVPVVAAAGSGLLGFPLMEALLLGRALHESLPRAAEAVVTGEMLATIAWQGSVSAEREGESIVLNGWVARAACAGEADNLLVRIGAGAAALVPTDRDGVIIEDASGLDLTVPEHSVRLQGVTIPAASVLPEGTWNLLCSDANVLRAAAILGSAEACLTLAHEHASTRRQFGRALSYNQAIRHALARQKLGLEGIRHAITRSVSDVAGPLQRDAAFLAAGVYGSAISEGALQIHGGMGFTWDVPVHRHLRRVRALQAQGEASATLAALGRRYIDAIAPVAAAAVSG
ncbi:acyl-CoA dehydrogenase family protein [Bradyrhizobium sp. SSUT18]|uniref:acyl-CoA dehydrogenase family protein n=1 Tax=Bradyrhizobium sp. SSUT18 TaxID=3040602 RepID=UPI00244704AF|nr:acyl-CoA dehydrogenase family protein [Bradyrhizobium sp. SSUT18]MDH2404670.1 acyl-CoA dehydrogenase family protein [Bradyrhizobium sp. SSUT18]